MQAGCVPDFRVFRPVGCGEPPHSEEGMPRSYTTLTLDDAKRMLQAGEAAAAHTGIAYNIAVVDGLYSRNSLRQARRCSAFRKPMPGQPRRFARQDGALIGSIDLAIGKAVTASPSSSRPMSTSTRSSCDRPRRSLTENQSDE